MSADMDAHRQLPLCRFCGKRIMATVNNIPFCGCKKSVDAAIAIVSRKIKDRS